MDWKTMWHYRIIDFGSPIMDFENTVQQVRLQSTIGGNRLRLHIDNSINAGDMEIRSITVSKECDGSAVPVTVGGASAPVIPAGKKIITDAAEFEVTAGDVLCVRIDFERINGLQSLCQTWAAQSWQSVFFSYDAPEMALSSTDVVPFLQYDIHKPNICMGLTQADVLTGDDVKTLAMFGDSITHMSYYTDALIRRIMREYPGKATVLNAGMGGNRLCYDATYVADMKEHSSIFGKAGFLRFREDVFGSMQPDAVLVLEGINDISHCFQFGHLDETPTAEMFAEKLTEIVEEAHMGGAKIYLCTILPEEIFQNEPWYEKCEALRREINGWIRTQAIAEGVIDFEPVASATAAPGKLREGFSIDGLHPNEYGGTLMADSLPLEEILFSTDFR